MNKWLRLLDRRLFERDLVTAASRLRAAEREVKEAGDHLMDLVVEAHERGACVSSPAYDTQ